MTGMRKYQLRANRIEMLALSLASLATISWAIYYGSTPLFASSLYLLVSLLSVFYFHSADRQDIATCIQLHKNLPRKVSATLFIVCLVLAASAIIIRCSASSGDPAGIRINTAFIATGLFNYIGILFGLYSVYRRNSLVFFHFDWIIGTLYAVTGFLYPEHSFPFFQLFISSVTVALLNYKLWQLLLFQIGMNGLGFVYSINIEQVSTVLQNTRGVHALLTFKIRRISLNKNRLWARLSLKQELSDIELIRLKCSILSQLKKHNIHQVIIETVQCVEEKEYL